MTIASRFVLKALERLSVGRLTIRLPTARHAASAAKAPSPRPSSHVRDWRFFRRVLLDGDIGFAEAYMEGFCDSPDLAGLIALLAENEKSLGRMAHTNALHDLALKLLHRRRRNSRRGSRKNIHAHYDLGNEFYRLWLDPTMTYSSALYEGTRRQAARSRADRQVRAHPRPDRRQAGRQHPGDRLRLGRLRRDGGAPRHAGHRRHDLPAAARLCPRSGWSAPASADRVDLQFRDYRDIEGRYDHIVSIEMIEAVGERYWPDYFAALKRHVAPGGSILVQAIVIADDFFESYRRHPDFIQTYVFPGGMLLSPTSLREQCRQAGLKVAELYSFGLDYARTLETWLGRFDRVADQVAETGLRRAFPPHVALLPRLLCRRLLDRPHGRIAGPLPAYITVTKRRR